jgi:multidrug resistance efflux pump
MLELLLCASITVLPDYLFRRYVQGKRFGHEITIYSVWYELRYGITTCLLLTISLITMVFYFHPSTKSATAIFRTVSILPEGSGRVEEVYVDVNSQVKAGDLLFRLDSAEQEAALLAANKSLAEVDAAFFLARTELDAAQANVEQAKSDVQQATDEFNTRSELNKREASSVSRREVERLEQALQGERAALAAAEAAAASVQVRIDYLLPAERATATANLDRAQVDLKKTEVRAGVDGTLQQFSLRKGDIVNPLLRPAGILVPAEAGRVALIAGFGQIESDVVEVGMIGEATCISRPFAIIPLVVTQVQTVIAGGQLRQTDQVIDVQSTATPGSITTFLQPLYEGQTLGIPPGGNCIANLYSNKHDELATVPAFSPDWLLFHAIDATALVHAIILRMQAAMLPVQTLVLSGGH